MKIMFIAYLLCYSSLSLSISEPNNTYEQLQTFFTSKSLRIKLDKKREQGDFHSTSNPSEKISPHKNINLHLQGVVIRKNYQPIIFINNTNTLKSYTINNDVKIKNRSNINESYIIPVFIKNKQVKLKPGQYWSESNPQVKDSYEN